MCMATVRDCKRFAVEADNCYSFGWQTPVCDGLRPDVARRHEGQFSIFLKIWTECQVDFRVGGDDTSIKTSSRNEFVQTLERHFIANVMDDKRVKYVQVFIV